MKNLLIKVRYRLALLEWKLQVGDYSPYGRYGVAAHTLRRAPLNELLDA
jgi:hypothetical protein